LGRKRGENADFDGSHIKRSRYLLIVRGRKMKRMFTIVFCVAAVTTIKGYPFDSVLDQSQTSGGGGAHVTADHFVAQTFTSSITGVLDHIDLAFYLGENHRYPTSVSILGTVGGRPVGSMLGSVEVAGFNEGWNSIDFLEELVVLFAGRQYSILLSNDDPTMYVSPTVSWQVKSGGIYPGGSLWFYSRSSGWYPPTSNVFDAAFQTWMIPDAPAIGVSSTSLDFVCAEGGPNPESKILSVLSITEGTLNWEITEDCNWLDVSPTSGRSSGEVNEVVISVDANGLDRGQYSCLLEISDPNAINSPEYISVNLDVRWPLIGFSPNSILFASPQGGPNPETQVLSIWNADIGTLNWNVTADCNWLDVDPNSGSCALEVNEVDLSVDGSGLLVGTYHCNLTISDPAALNSPQTALVRLQICGETVYVPEDFSTIQDAIDHTWEGGTVIVSEGTYTGPGNRDIDFNGKAITVRCVDPNDPDIVAATIIFP
jgi:hypothetical protein